MRYDKHLDENKSKRVLRFFYKHIHQRIVFLFFFALEVDPNLRVIE